MRHFASREVVSVGIAALITASGIGIGAADAPESFSPYVDENGGIQRPTGYRDGWAHLGSWVVPAKEAPGYGFHDVYTQPGTVEAYQKTGEFPDGAVLVKEIRKVTSGGMTTGEVMWAGEPTVWFIMIKDQEGRFAESGSWGDGWGWALFEAADPDVNVSESHQADCIPCHGPARETDWVYIQGYPALRSAAPR